MGSVWFSKKAFLYFGGAAIILIGGAIVLMAPYHYINFAVTENNQRTFNIWDKDGYYPQVDVSVSVTLGNSSIVEIGIVFEENTTLETYIINITLDEDNIVETPDTSYLEDSIIVDIQYGNYTVTFDQIIGAGTLDVGLDQMSDKRLFVGIGGTMNIVGLFMAIGGYFVPGTFLPTDSDTIIDWGYDEDQDEDSNSG